MEVYIINGKPRSGKDTFIKYLQELGYAVSNQSSVDVPKLAYKVLGWDGESKDPKDREAMSDIKKIWKRCFNGPIKFALEMAEKYQAMDALFLHIREPEEIEETKTALIKAGYICHTLYVSRDVDMTGIENSSDARVTEYAYDITVSNEGTLEELKDAASVFIMSRQ